MIDVVPNLCEAIDSLSPKHTYHFVKADFIENSQQNTVIYRKNHGNGGRFRDRFEGSSLDGRAQNGHAMNLAQYFSLMSFPGGSLSSFVNYYACEVGNWVYDYSGYSIGMSEDCLRVSRMAKFTENLMTQMSRCLNSPAENIVLATDFYTKEMVTAGMDLDKLSERNWHQDRDGSAELVRLIVTLKGPKTLFKDATSGSIETVPDNHLVVFTRDAWHAAPSILDRLEHARVSSHDGNHERFNLYLIGQRSAVDQSAQGNIDQKTPEL